MGSAVDELDLGVYRYAPEAHALLRVGSEDRHKEVTRASLGQLWIAHAPLILVLTAHVGQTTGRYGERGQRYVQMEVGHAAQNIDLQPEALGLGTTLMGAFRHGELAAALDIPSTVEPLGVLPVGIPSP